jgi:hypothetical protein
MLVTNRDSTVHGDYNRVYGTDAHFQFYNRLEFDSYLLRSNTPGKSGKDQARRFATAWRDDELVISGEYNTVQTNFNPEMGFIRRKDNTNYSGDFSWLPRLRKSKTIRNLIFTTTLDYFQGGNGKVETRTQGITIGTQFQNSGNINFSVTENFDRLVNEFLIRSRRLGHASDLPIAAGDYKYREYLAKFTSSQRRKITGNGNVSMGEFWNGHRKSFGGSVGLRPDYHLNVNLDYSHNRVNLPGGSFSTSLVGARLLYGFSPRFFFNAFRSIQRRHAPGELEHPLRHYSPSPERSLPCIQRQPGHADRSPPGACIHHQVYEPFQLLGRGQSTEHSRTSCCLLSDRFAQPASGSRRTSIGGPPRLKRLSSRTSASSALAFEVLIGAAIHEEPYIRRPHFFPTLVAIIDPLSWIGVVLVVRRIVIAKFDVHP